MILIGLTGFIRQPVFFCQHVSVIRARTQP